MTVTWKTINKINIFIIVRFHFHVLYLIWEYVQFVPLETLPVYAPFIAHSSLKNCPKQLHTSFVRIYSLHHAKKVFQASQWKTFFAMFSDFQWNFLFWRLKSVTMKVFFWMAIVLAVVVLFYAIFFLWLFVFSTVNTALNYIQKSLLFTFPLQQLVRLEPKTD